MGQSFNIYADESCHLENDRQRVMVLGAVWCSRSRVRTISRRLKEIRRRHGLPPGYEFKWKKVSANKSNFYKELIDYFFRENDLHFRGLVVPDKTVLDHDAFQQTHDTWYYKMYFTMLTTILHTNASYRIYLDIKDTRSAAKVQKLHEVLCNKHYDLCQEMIESVQNVRSEEVSIMQLADLLVGAVSYANRNLDTSATKVELIAQIRGLSSHNLIDTTWPPYETKFNLLRWRATRAVR
jgi:hypothetical protein